MTDDTLGHMLAVLLFAGCHHIDLDELFALAEEHGLAANGEITERGRELAQQLLATAKELL